MQFTLGPADALAWEKASPRLRRRDRVAVGAALFAGMGLVKVIGAQFEGLHWLHSLPMALALIVLPAVAVLLSQRYGRILRARERLPDPVAVTVEVGPDRISERMEGRKAPVAIGAKSLRAVVETRGHVFLWNGTDVVILPAQAFPDAGAKADFAREWSAKLD